MRQCLVKAINNKDKEDEEAIIELFFWDAVWTILILNAGASMREDDRAGFLHYVGKPENGWTEWRFIGHLGFGGKLRKSTHPHNAPTVDYYPEDETPERKAIVASTNMQLRALYDQWKSRTGPFV